MGKLKFAIYWGAACGGCDVAVVDTHEKLLDIAAAADILFWPVAMDFKYHDVEEFADKSVDVCLFSGAVRNSENEHVAHLLRQKSNVMVAFGACAQLGGIPGLANEKRRQEILDYVYHGSPSTVSQKGVYPQETTLVPEGELKLPKFYDTVMALDQVVDVDYYLPGCPPESARILEVVQAIVTGNLPPKGAVVGALDKALCDSCPRKREEKKVKAFYRPQEVLFDPERCFLEQGLICLGPATRGGCSDPPRCIRSNMPCEGCYGPPPDVTDQGAKMLSAVGSIIDSQDPSEIKKVIDGIVDPLGTFYRFGLPASALRKKRFA
jgi:F420-non-reducing hydrogenase small subunit